MHEVQEHHLRSLHQLGADRIFGKLLGLRGGALASVGLGDGLLHDGKVETQVALIQELLDELLVVEEGLSIKHDATFKFFVALMLPFLQ